MPWLQVRIPLPADSVEPVEDALLAAGAQSVSLEDAGNQPIVEPGPGEAPLWPEVRVVALFDADTERSVIRDALQKTLATVAGEPEFELLPDREWQRAWMDDWRPLRFGRRLWIAPLGDSVEESGAVIVRLDPGLAFGTGTHPTTALCLEWLDGLDLAGCRVLDHGCGSGVLAVAALRLGAAEAAAVDIEPQALEATGLNALANGVAGRLRVHKREAMPDGPFDIVLANILAGPLIEAAPVLAARQPAGGRIALSGIRQDQAEAVIAAYGTDYEIGEGAVRDGWVRLDGLRR